MHKVISDKSVVLSPEETEVGSTIVAADDIETAQNMAEFLIDDIASGRDSEQG